MFKTNIRIHRNPFRAYLRLIVRPDCLRSQKYVSNIYLLEDRTSMQYKLGILTHYSLHSYKININKEKYILKPSSSLISYY